MESNLSVESLCEKLTRSDLKTAVVLEDSKALAWVGNGSPVGASANVIALGFCAKAGKKVSFIEFVKLGLPLTIITLMAAMIYVKLRYYP